MGEGWWGGGRRFYSGPDQIASFSRWEFSQSKKHDAFKSRLLFRKWQISRVNFGVRNFQYTLETRNNLHDCTLKNKKLGFSVKFEFVYVLWEIMLFISVM